MNIYVNTTFEGHYPVGTAAVVRADNPVLAAELLNKALHSSSLPGTAKPEDMRLMDTPVMILCDGNY